MILDLDLHNGTNEIAKLLASKDLHPRLFKYFSQRLIDIKFLTSNLHQYLDTEDNITTIRKILSTSPQELNTIVDSCVKVGIKDIKGEYPILKESIKILGSVTPLIYQEFKNKKTDKEKKEFCDSINSAKRQVLNNSNLRDSVLPKSILAEIVYLAYKPTNISFEELKRDLESGRVPDCTQHLQGLSFPQDGYEISLFDENVNLAEGEQIDPQFYTSVERLKYDGEDVNRDKTNVLVWLAKGSSGPNLKQWQAICSFLPESEKKVTSDTMRSIDQSDPKAIFSGLNSLMGLFGIVAKDNIQAAVTNFLENYPNARSDIERVLKSSRYKNFLKSKLGEDYEQNGLEYCLQKLLLGIFSTEQQKLRRELKKFTKDSHETIDTTSDNYKLFISKNQASYYGKASGGICTASDVHLFTMPEYFHINLARNEEVVLGNVQAYMHTDDDGNKVLVLRGFNPSESALKAFSARSFVEETLRVGRQFAKENKFDKMAIVYDEGWHPLSNRQQVADYFRSDYANRGASLKIPYLAFNSNGKGTTQVRELSLK